MKTLVSLFLLVALARVSFATTLIVDKNGGGQFRSIQPAIDAASPNDTVKVWPETYTEQISLNKSITLMGSGYENTIVTGSFNYTVTITSGWMQWFMISSTGGAGVKISGGTLRNCVIMGCSGDGVYCNAVGGTGAALVANCVVVNNNGFGINVDSPGLLTVVNCISRNNTSYGFEGYYNILTISYSNGSRYYTAGNQGCIDQDPLFTSSSDFRIADGSPGWNTGQPSLSDPDGSRSDMGYFGGPDCPIYPVVTQIIISPSGTTINLSAKARANY